MPAGNHRCGKVEADDRMDRKHERRRDTGQQQIRRVITMPVHGAAAPTHGKKTIHHAPHATVRAIAERGQVGD